MENVKELKRLAALTRQKLLSTMARKDFGIGLHKKILATFPSMPYILPYLRSCVSERGWPLLPLA